MAGNSQSRRATRTKGVTISDVAAAAGVSTATVSHVFSGRRPVSPSASERVLEVAQELGYQANNVARGLATGRSFVVALHTPFDADDIIGAPFLAGLLTTISTTASAAGYGFILIPPDPDLAAAQAASLIGARRIDGALLLDPLPPGALRDTLDAAELPVVTIGRTQDRDDDFWVDGDMRVQTADALGHLASRGYHRPALLVPQSRSVYFPHLQAHYEAWCEQHASAPLVVRAEAMTEDAAFRALSSQSEAFDSVFCANDVLASGALRAVWGDADSGRPPTGVIGIGDSYHARHARPPLTSIDTHTADKGRLATQALLSIIEERAPRERHVVVPHDLVVRESTPFRDA